MVSDKSFTFSSGTMSPLGFLVAKGKVGMVNGRIGEDVEGQSAFTDGNWRVYRSPSSSLVPGILGDPAHPGNLHRAG